MPTIQLRVAYVLALLGAACVHLATAGGAGAESRLFRDVSRASGLPVMGPTSGVAAADLDGDGDLDLILNLHTNGVPPVAWQVAPLKFEVGELDAPGVLVEDHHSTTIAALGAAGELQLYLGTGADRGLGTGRNVLLVRRESGWVDLAPDLGLTDPFGRGRSALFLDVIGAPDLDLLVLNFRSRARVFADVDLVSSPQDRALEWWPGLDAAPVHPDSAAVDLANFGSRLLPGLLDDGSPFFLVWGFEAAAWRTGSSGIPEPWSEPGLDMALGRRPVHAAIADLDADGRNDVYFVYGDGPAREHPAYHNELLLQREPGVFTAAEYSGGALLDGTGHRVVAGDFDLDGWVDLLVLHRGPRKSERVPSLLHGTGGANPELYAGTTGLESRRGGLAQDVLAADLDQDGDLDLVLCQGDHTERLKAGGFRVYRNWAADRGGGSIQFSLEGGSGSNRAGYGARLEVHAGERSWIRDHWPVQVGGSAMPLPVHFGLGSVDVVDSVIVRWPGGSVDVARELGVGGKWHWREGDPPRQVP